MLTELSLKVFTTPHFEKGWREVLFLRLSGRKSASDEVKKNKCRESINWSSQLADELHKPIIKNFPKRKVYANGIDKIWAADLVEMQSFSKFNRGVRYLLTVIDVFSKYGWMLLLKDKTGKSVADALKEIFKKSKRKPEKLSTDKGRELYNKHEKDLGVEFYSTENEEKSSVVERWNRTMKEKMFKYFTANNTNKYIDVLDDFVERYKNTRHSSIKMSPVEAKNSFLCRPEICP